MTLCRPQIVLRLAVEVSATDIVPEGYLIGTSTRTLRWGNGAPP